MTPLVILNLIGTYGPTVLPLVQKLVDLVEKGNAPVTAADISELIAYGQKQSSDYLTAAGIKIVDGKVVPL